MEKLSILLLKGTNTIVVRKNQNSNIFISTPDSIIITKDNLVMLINFMVKQGILSPKVIQGILEEVNTV
jgi:hypothetical protein